MSVSSTSSHQKKGSTDTILLGIPECANPLECRFCGKVFTRTFYRKEHERIHTGEKPFSCGICGKMFNSHGSCRKHERIHTKKNESLECEHCGKKFRDTKNLRIHVRTHTGEKPFSCHICGRSFGFETVLKKHLQFHNGQKQFQCLVCNESYFTAYDLRIHVRSHTVEKPYKCHYCNQSFATERRRNIHEKCHEKSNVHQCKSCGSLFRSANSLATHEAQGALVGGCKMIQDDNDDSQEDESMSPVEDEIPETHRNNGNSLPGYYPGLSEVDIEFLGQTLEENSSVIEANTNVKEHPYERSVSEPEVYPTGLIRTTERGIKEEPLESIDRISCQNQRILSNDSTETRDSNIPTTSARPRTVNGQHETFGDRNRYDRVSGKTCDPNGQLSIITSDSKSVQTDPHDSLELLYSELEAAREVHECKSCGILFRNYSMFLVHKTLHVNPVRPFVCHICGVESKDNVDFNSHLIWHMK